MTTYTLEPNALVNRLEKKLQKKMRAMKEKRSYNKEQRWLAQLSGTRRDEAEQYIFRRFLIEG